MDKTKLLLFYLISTYLCASEFGLTSVGVVGGGEEPQTRTSVGVVGGGEVPQGRTSVGVVGGGAEPGQMKGGLSKQDDFSVLDENIYFQSRIVEKFNKNKKKCNYFKMKSNKVSAETKSIVDIYNLLVLLELETKDCKKCAENQGQDKQFTKKLNKKQYCLMTKKHNIAKEINIFFDLKNKLEDEKKLLKDLNIEIEQYASMKDYFLKLDIDIDENQK